MTEVVCTYDHGRCQYIASFHVLVSKSVPVGSAPQYDLEHVCIPHLNGYHHLIAQGLVTLITEKEALVAEVMLS